MGDRVTGPAQPFRLVLTPRGARATAPSLLDWIRQHPEFRAKVHGGDEQGAGKMGLGDAAIIAIVAQGALLGLFRLLKAWVDQQRAEATVRVKVRGSNVEIKVSARTDPAQLVAQLTRATQALGGAVDPGQRE